MSAYYVSLGHKLAPECEIIVYYVIVARFVAYWIDSHHIFSLLKWCAFLSLLFFVVPGGVSGTLQWWWAKIHSSQHSENLHLCLFCIASLFYACLLGSSNYGVKRSVACWPSCLPPGLHFSYIAWAFRSSTKLFAPFPQHKEYYSSFILPESCLLVHLFSSFSLY